MIRNRRDVMDDSVEAFAKSRHGDQMRKYGYEPYWTHLKRVAALVESVPHTEEMVAAAWLHDVVEDTDTNLDEIVECFGLEVALIVQELTNPRIKGTNREYRNAVAQLRLRDASWQAQTIKCADIIDNVTGLVALDPDFARVYLAEKAMLLRLLVGADPGLYCRAAEAVEQEARKLL